MIYKEIEIDITTTDYSDGVAILPLSDGSIICISEQDATPEELEIIRQIKEDVLQRPVELPETVPRPPTTEEKLRADIDFIAIMSGIDLEV